MHDDRAHQTDILILGSGGAGLFAALHAHAADPALDITVATKGLLGKCGCTRMVQGGYNVALNPATRSSATSWTRSRAASGCPTRNWPGRWSTQAIERISELENEVGCFFDRNPDGTLHGKAFAGQTFDRTVHKGDLTGIEIINRLMEQVWARPGIRASGGASRGRADPGQRTAASIAGVLMIDIRTGGFRFVAGEGGAARDRRRSDDVSLPHALGRQDHGRARHGAAPRACRCATWRWCSSIRPACSPGPTPA